MNREILFRGKRIDNGKWVHGLLCQYHEEISAKIALNDFGVFEPGMAYCVVPATVGRYTGLPDKNGRKIFEGDIIDLSGYMIKDVGVVKFGVYKDNDMTDDYPCGHVGFYVETKEQYYARKDILFFFSECKVVGNIHDKMLGGDS